MIKLDNCPESEYSVPFLQGMINRMGVSYHKYGKVADNASNRTDSLKSMQLRLQKYKETGNTEFLIDAANFLMVEFMVPSVDNAYFKPTDSNESPGLVAQSGKRIRHPDQAW